ncbi:hypothetical protein DFH11DRAFT_1594303 [Phellopilus nigrolimitatus]|nr:hypothetical protein DFH11DRAFT_1594303 [Phellopilus nigrolimitatus]
MTMASLLADLAGNRVPGCTKAASRHSRQNVPSSIWPVQAASGNRKASCLAQHNHRLSASRSLSSSIILLTALQNLPPQRPPLPTALAFPCTGRGPGACTDGPITSHGNAIYVRTRWRAREPSNSRAHFRLSRRMTRGPPPLFEQRPSRVHTLAENKPALGLRPSQHGKFFACFVHTPLCLLFFFFLPPRRPAPDGAQFHFEAKPG